MEPHKKTACRDLDEDSPCCSGHKTQVQQQFRIRVGSSSRRDHHVTLTLINAFNINQFSEFTPFFTPRQRLQDSELSNTRACGFGRVGHRSLWVNSRLETLVRLQYHPDNSTRCRGPSMHSKSPRLSMGLLASLLAKTP